MFCHGVAQHLSLVAESNFFMQYLDNFCVTLTFALFQAGIHNPPVDLPGQYSH